jgi:hypothetical protein
VAERYGVSSKTVREGKRDGRAGKGGGKGRDRQRDRQTIAQALFALSQQQIPGRGCAANIPGYEAGPDHRAGRSVTDVNAAERG